MTNYGSQLWNAMPFPPELAHVRVSSLEALLAGPCKLAISCVAPDVGYVEDLLTDGGVTVCPVVVVAPPAVIAALPTSRGSRAWSCRHRPRGAGLLNLAVPSNGEPHRARGQPGAPPRDGGRVTLQVSELRIGRRLDRAQGELPVFMCLLLLRHVLLMFLENVFGTGDRRRLRSHRRLRRHLTIALRARRCDVPGRAGPGEHLPRVGHEGGHREVHTGGGGLAGRAGRPSALRSRAPRRGAHWPLYRRASSWHPQLRSHHGRVLC